MNIPKVNTPSVPLHVIVRICGLKIVIALSPAEENLSWDFFTSGSFTV